MTTTFKSFTDEEILAGLHWLVEEGVEMEETPARMAMTLGRLLGERNEARLLARTLARRLTGTDRDSDAVSAQEIIEALNYPDPDP